MAVRLSVCGWTAERRLVTGDLAVQPALVGADHLPVVAFTAAPGGALCLDVGQWTRSLASELGPAPGRHVTGGRADRALHVELPLTVEAGPVPAEVVLLRNGGSRYGPQWRKALVHRSGDERALVEVPLGRLAPGEWAALWRFGGPGSGQLEPLGVTIRQPVVGRRSIVAE